MLGGVWKGVEEALSSAVAGAAGIDDHKESSSFCFEVSRIALSFFQISRPGHEHLRFILGRIWGTGGRSWAGRGLFLQEQIKDIIIEGFSFSSPDSVSCRPSPSCMAPH